MINIPYNLIARNTPSLLDNKDDKKETIKEENIIEETSESLQIKKLKELKASLEEYSVKKHSNDYDIPFNMIARNNTTMIAKYFEDQRQAEIVNTIYKEVSKDSSLTLKKSYNA